MTRNARIVSFLILAGAFGAFAQDAPASRIRLNQIGFYPAGPKMAIVESANATDFTITSQDRMKTFFRGKLGDRVKSAFSDKVFRTADFTAFTTEGQFVMVVPGVGYSYNFEIRRNVHDHLTKAAIRNYYYQRLSIPLEETYAGKWARPMGHPDDKVRVHSSAASVSRPEGTVLSSPRGWYDAGDYNKYVVNSGITMGTMFASYEDFPDYYNKLELKIPESGNAIPDLLDELLWNLRWMLTMQDPADGGVYHKLTNAKFDGMVMPHQANDMRYVVQKGTAATLNFAAVTAQASRILTAYKKELPGLADSCLVASRKAWQWAKANPSVVYDQHALNKTYDPDIATGTYGDRNFADEFLWAGVELFVTTRDKSYLDEKTIRESKAVIPSWNQVGQLAYYTLLRFEKQLGADHQDLVRSVREKVIGLAEDLAAGTTTHAFRTAMGKHARDYIWGSSSVAANQGVCLLYAYRMTGEKKFLDLALSNLDYLLGRNATGYSFVTGFGSKTPMHPHHRPSEADGIIEPVPGMLSGGPNPGMQDKCTYPSAIPEEAYVDDVCSYASNEVAINWNAPLVYLAGAIEALAGSARY